MQGRVRRNGLPSALPPMLGSDTCFWKADCNPIGVTMPIHCSLSAKPICSRNVYLPLVVEMFIRGGTNDNCDLSGYCERISPLRNVKKPINRGIVCVCWKQKKQKRRLWTEKLRSCCIIHLSESIGFSVVERRSGNEEK